MWIWPSSRKGSISSKCNQGTFETRQGFLPPKESKGTNEASNVRFLFTVANRIYVLFVARCAKIGVRGWAIFSPYRIYPKSFEQQIPNVEDDQMKKLIYLKPRVFLLLKCLQLFQILNQWIHFLENVYFLNSIEYQDGI